VGLLIIVGIGLFVLVALLYVTRTDSNHEVFDGVEPHIGYRVTPSERSALTRRPGLSHRARRRPRPAPGDARGAPRGRRRRRGRRVATAGGSRAATRR